MIKKQTIIWTAVPNSIRSGKLRLSVVPSFRLESDELRPILGSFPAIADWPNRSKRFTVRFGRAPGVLASVVGPAPEPALWTTLFNPTTYVRSYEVQDHLDRTIVSYPAANVAGFMLDRYQRLALEYPTRLPPMEKVIDNRYFGALRRPGNLIEQYDELKAMIREDQLRAAEAMRRAFLEWMNGIPILDEPTTPSDRAASDPSSLPPGLRDHIGAVNDSNRDQATGGIADSWGGVYGEDAPASADAGDNEPRGGLLPYRERPLEERKVNPAELPIGIPYSQVPDPLRDFLAAGLFHNGMTMDATRDGDESRVIQPVFEMPEFDFHQGISILSQYPELMRRLGLVIDIEVPWNDSIPPKEGVRVEVAWASNADNDGVSTVNISSQTQYELNAPAGIFLPRQRPGHPEVFQGLLNLSTSNAYELLQLDTDNAAQSMTAYINNALQGADSTEEVSVPPIKSDGISLVRKFNAIKLMHSFVVNAMRNQELQKELAPVFFAEDLIRGYRIDILDKRTDRWYPLCRRNGLYHFLEADFTRQWNDEGWVSLAATAPLDQTSRDLYLHEAIATWRGWGLTTPPPGPVTNSDGTPMLDEEGNPAPVEDPATTYLKLRPTFQSPPDTLPALRYGVSYQLRARTVDLAGNSIPFEAEADPDSFSSTMAAPEHAYCRYDPVPSPGVTALAEPVDGETLDRLVIRTYNIDDDLRQAYVDAGKSVPTPVTAIRHLSPPSTGIQNVEMHGVFDGPDGMRADLYAEAVVKAMSEEPAGLQTGEVSREPVLDLPYLPDPLARDAVLRNLPDQPPDQEPMRVPFYVSADRQWNDMGSFLLELSPGSGEPDWSPSDRILRVHLAEGEEQEIEVSSGLRADDLELMGMWQALKKGLYNEDKTIDQEKLDLFTTMAMNGQLWMLTPSKRLKLVHATVRPVEAPTAVKIGTTRRLGETAARVTAEVTVHPQSTGTVVLSAAWDDYSDDPAKSDAPQYFAVDGAATEQVVHDRTQPRMVFRTNQEFHDTRYRRIRYYATGATRFQQYFPEVNADSDLEYQADIDKILRWTKRSEPYVVDVLSSAPPAAPVIHSVIPVFGWERVSDDGDKVVLAKRRGGGLRVYLERPWLSSGEGEQLGVLVWTGTGAVPESLSTLTTQAARDPIWRGAAPPTNLRLQHFPAAAATQGDLALGEVPEQFYTDTGAHFEVAGHTVAYDESRKLWYADVVIDTGEAYFPFVRMSLCRYQPNSVAGAHLSPVVFTDFAQLTPERATSITRTAGAGGTTVRLTVTGPAGRGRSGPNTIVVSAEQQGTDETDLQWLTVGGVAPVTLTYAHEAWTGEMTLPDTAGVEYRLVIKEYEHYAADAGPATRVVFADTVAV